MSNLRQPFTIPPGRLVGGSLTKWKEQDAEGKPLVYKSGPKAGQPRKTIDFAVAVAKTPGQTHWATKPADWDTNPQTKDLEYWGAKIWATGHASFPGGQAQRPDFSWKIVDGDSQIPNKRGKRPCDQEGHAGHWVIWFSSEILPRVFNATGTAPAEAEAVKLGHYVQVAGNVDGNGAVNQPGVFLNHNIVAHSGFGPEIVVGPDPTSVGFGRGMAPAGMSATPVGGLPNAAPAPAAALPPPPGAAAAAPAPAPAPMPSATPPAPTAVQPHTGFLNTPAPPPAAAPAPAPAPAAPPPPAAAPPAGPQMTAKAGTTPYEAFRAQGWSDDALRAHGYMA